ncbi:MAG: lysozyme [Pseudomonadota bacterium]
MTETNTSDRKPIFDTVRSLLKRGFKQREVDAIDSSIDRALRRAGLPTGKTKNLPQDSVPGVSGVLHARRTEPKRARQPKAIGEAGTELIKRFEGCARLRRDGMIEAYPDPGTGADPWTIGWGATGPGLKKGERIGPGTVWTQKQCDKRLAKDLKRYAADVTKAIGTAPTTQSQFDALVSFHYNTGAIGRATLTKKHVAGDFEGAAKEFKRWNKAGGRVLKGLVRRRGEEERLYRGG